MARVSASLDHRVLTGDTGATGATPGDTGQPVERPVHPEFLSHGERLPEADALSEAALHQLEMLLKPRIAAAARGEVLAKSVEQIFAEVRHASES